MVFKYFLPDVILILMRIPVIFPALVKEVL